MNQDILKNRLSTLWNELYEKQHSHLLENFIDNLNNFKDYNAIKPVDEGWYKDAIVYSLYVDLFNGTFKGLIQKLDYLDSLGVNCIWLLPVLESPMRDAGFDISDYRAVRKSLLGLPDSAPGEEAERLFKQFLDEAHKRNMKVIFDIAMNHCSDEHPWFLEAKSSKDSPYRDYFIWNDDENKYSDARLLFKGMCPSNWEKSGDQYFFHRFFEFQPDLNYRNPKVLVEMCQNLLYWVSQDVDGFRADAIPYLWKEEGTDCENLPETHTIVKFFKTVLDYVRPNTLLLAEACQKPVEVVKYIGSGEECNAGYHFPLMPMIYKSIATGSREPVKHTLSTDVTPAISSDSQWFTFLRCHDELSLELVYVSEEDRKLIHESYCHNEMWDFRLGEGISARLSELMERNPDKIALAFSIMLTLPGTPIIYYGDEFAKLNDESYYKEQIEFTGKDDTRFLVRGEVDWNKVADDLRNPGTLSYQVFKKLSKMIGVRKSFKAFGRGDMEWIDIKDANGNVIPEVMAYARVYDHDHFVIIQNLSDKDIFIPEDAFKICAGKEDRLGQPCPESTNDGITLKPYSYYWI
jgi:maltose alpha-D-glucosyltransferase/alpha-amylase